MLAFDLHASMKVTVILNLHQLLFRPSLIAIENGLLLWPLTSVKVIIILNLYQQIFWLNLVATDHVYYVWPLLTFDLHEGPHHPKLVSAVDLAKFDSHVA